MLYEKKDLLAERYDYDGRELVLRTHNTWYPWTNESRLTCLHLLAERNKTRSVRLFLRLCPMRTDEDLEVSTLSIKRLQIDYFCIWLCVLLRLCFHTALGSTTPPLNHTLCLFSSRGYQACPYTV